LSYANDITASYDRIKYVYADANCNLKLVLEKENRSHHIRFNTEQELAILLAKEEYAALLSEETDVKEFLGEENDEPLNEDLYL